MDPVFRHKALVAAASVVMAMGPGCKVTATLGDSDAVDTAPVDSAVDSDVDSDTDTDTDTTSDGAPDCTAAQVDVTTCCNDLAAWCTAQYADWEEAQTCIYGPNYDGSTGCIPWGPPTPPEATYA